MWMEDVVRLAGCGVLEIVELHVRHHKFNGALNAYLQYLLLIDLENSSIIADSSKHPSFFHVTHISLTILAVNGTQ